MTKKSNIPFLPYNENTIGIIGGGQLGKMIALSASRSGYKTHLYCPEGDNPAETVVDEVTYGQWDDNDKLIEFSKKVSCATSEFENIPYKSLELLAKKTKIVPSSSVFRCAQIRSKEKEMAIKSGFKTPKWFLIKNIDDLISSMKNISNQGILKTNSLGYDGKGQIKINKSSNFFKAWENLGFVECVLEEKLEFRREISIMYFKSLDSSEGFFPISENYHEKGILKKTIAPAEIDEKIKIDLKTKTKILAENLNFYGVLALELFELLDGSIVFNEIAPRPHNSFHWTLNGCNSSQFDILIRTICGLPVKDVKCNGKWEMTNLIGQDVNNIHLFKDQNYILHIYGKKYVKTGRKMGHYNKNIT